MRIPPYVRAALEAGCDLIEYPEGYRIVYHGFASPEVYKTSTAAAKAALAFMEVTKTNARAIAKENARARISGP